VGEMIREICVVSVICAVASNLAPEGPAKRIMSICCCVIMMLVIVDPLGEFDMEKYADYLAKYKEIELKLSNDAQDTQTRLNRLVIEEEYKAYIMDKAKEKHIDITAANVQLEWSTEGFWTPCRLEIISDASDDSKKYFISILLTELGIGEDKITWLRPE